MSALLCCFIDIRKMLRYLRVCIEAVYDIEILRIFGCLLRKVSCASAAYYKDIDLVLMGCDIRRIINGDTLCKDLHL